MNSVYSIIHEAEHAMLFPNRGANESFGILMALVLSRVSTPALKDISAIIYETGQMMRRLMYFNGDNVVWKFMVWFGILTGMYYVLVVISNVIAAFVPFILDRRHFKIDRHINVDRASALF